MSERFGRNLQVSARWHCLIGVGSVTAEIVNLLGVG
nr:MAG TPA: Dynein light chain type 1 [Bacteriophage sp.]